MSLFLPNGSVYKSEQEDIYLLGIIWRGSSVHILTNRPMIQRFDHHDKRKIADELRKVFEKDFGPDIYL